LNIVVEIIEINSVSFLGKDLFDSDSDEDLFATKPPVKSETPEMESVEKGRVEM